MTGQKSLKVSLTMGGLHAHVANSPLPLMIDDICGNDLAWVTGDALCAQTDTDAFFPARGQGIHFARKVCRLCPLQAPCLDYALSHHVWGVWGGTSEGQRRRMGAPTTSEPADDEDTA